MQIHLVTETDKQQVDFFAKEAFFDKAKAEARAKELTAKEKHPDTYFYEVHSIDVVDEFNISLPSGTSIHRDFGYDCITREHIPMIKIVLPRFFDTNPISWETRDKIASMLSKTISNSEGVSDE